MNSDAYQGHAIACCQREDVGARYRCSAGSFDVGFDGVDNLVAAGGVPIGGGILLAGECGSIIQKYRRIAALQPKSKTVSSDGLQDAKDNRGVPASHINETVVEEKPEDGGSHAWLLVDGLRHGGAHNLL